MIRVSLVALVASIVLVGCAPEAVDVDATAPGLQQGLTTTTLSPVADTHVRRGTPYYAYGSEALLRVGTTDRRKSLVAFSPAAITSALAGQRVVSAHLELTLGAAAASFSAGQALVAHPLAKPFVEARATYSCADDSAPTNWANNCTTANLWTLESAPFPWRATGIPLAVTTGTTGTLRFNVTADIVDFKAGTYAHNGWVVLRTLDTQGGEANFRSREAASPPRLVIVTEPEAVCGNGVREATEACDDGNTTNADGCTACVVDRCGDGLVNNAGAEQCDDGNIVNADGCTACIVDRCGDSLVNNAGDEECDDGNELDGDGCSSCVIEFCGDAMLNNASTEQCDDGNNTNDDGCTACVIDVCGDGIVNNGDAETCDDGNAVDDDGCTACTTDVCGDGIVNNTGAEQCDDGNVNNGDGCSSTCVAETPVDQLPQVTISHPINGDSTPAGRPLLVEIGAADDHLVVAVELEVLGLPSYFRASATTAPFSFEVPVPLVSVGRTATLRATAVDDAGQRSVTAEVLVQVSAENEPPSISFRSPVANSGVTFGTHATIEADVDDNVGVDKVEFRFDNQTLGTIQTAPWLLTWTVPDLPGPHTLTAIASDTAGNVTSVMNPISIIGNFPPVVASLSGPSSVVAGQQFGVGATASDDVSVSYVDFHMGFDDEMIGGELPKVASDNLRPYGTSFTVHKSRTGQTFTIYAVACDNTGKKSITPYLSKTYVVRPDPPPTAQMTRPLNGAQAFVGTQVVQLEAIATDDFGVASVEFYANGVLVGTATRPAGIPGFPTTYATPFTLSAAIAYDITAVATDTGGNKTTSQAVRITGIRRN